MTLGKMLKDTMSFIFLVCCYMIVAATVFTTLFENADPSEYGTLSLSVTTLFSAMTAQYDYNVPNNYMISLSIFLDIHVFLSNVFLMNYLIAILSTVY
jgi:hypothetical protein